jgi:hypothetical protein
MRNTSAFQPNTAGGPTKAYYPLHGNSNDYSGNTNTGTDTAITYPQGRFGQAAKFNGSSSQISLPNITAVSGGTARTISMWIKPDSLSTIESLYVSGVDTANNRFAFHHSVVSAGDLYLACINNDHHTNASVITANVWQHVALVYDGGTLSTTTVKIYVNGVSQTLTKAGVNTAAANTTNSNFALGNDVLNAGRFYGGLQDEVIIESRAWTAKEVETYYRKSMLNYKKGFWSKFLQAFSISETVSLTESSSNLRGRLFTTSETTTLTESIISSLGKIFTILESVSLSESLTSARTFLFNIVESTGLIEVIARVKKKWTNSSKNSSTWTNDSKNSSTWTNEDKS